MEQNEIRSAIEAILVASPDPITPAELSVALEIPQNEVDGRIEEIAQNLEQTVGGFMLERVAGGIRIATRPEFDEQLRRFFSRKRENRMSIAALETLAIVAYRQPITGPEVSDLRGVNSSGVLRTLLERRMIRIAGRKNVVGSPFLYRTTKDFLLHFGLERIQDLPKLEEFGEILGEQMAEDLGLGDLTEAAEQAVEDHENQEEVERQASDEAAAVDAENAISSETSEDGSFDDDEGTVALESSGESPAAVGEDHAGPGDQVADDDDPDDDPMREES